MWENCYLLDLTGLMEGDPAEKKAMREKMEALLDQERLLKYHQKRNDTGALQSLGGGALLQLAVADYQDKICREGVEQLTPEALLQQMKGRQSCELHYYSGKMGKPYFCDIPLYFSLSHSGALVFLAVSEAENGADIQKMTKTDWKKMSARFYSEKEQELFSQCEEEKGRELFFQYWAKKEALGKYTGEGVAGFLAQDLTGDKIFITKDEREQGITFPMLQEWKAGNDRYVLAVCRAHRKMEQNAGRREEDGAED